MTDEEMHKREISLLIYPPTTAPSVPERRGSSFFEARDDVCAPPSCIRRQEQQGILKPQALHRPEMGQFEQIPMHKSGVWTAP